MAETGNGAAAAPPAPGAQPPQVKMQVLAQFIRDMSFENALALRGLSEPSVQPEIQVGVSLDVKKRAAPNQFEVVTKFKVTSNNKADKLPIFLMELEYGGVFHIEGLPDEHLHPYLLIECPRMLFPFARRIISDVTRDGGFPPLLIDQVDYLALYRQEIQRRAEAQKAEKPPAQVS